MIVLMGGIVWLACIVWVAIDAERSRIGPVFWPLATLISGPLGLVAYGIVRELATIVRELAAKER